MLISIIIPYFKKKKYIKKAVRSILNQTYKNFEIIIIYDDPDLDDFKIIEELKKLDDLIFVIKKNINFLIFIIIFITIKILAKQDLLIRGLE